MVGVKKVGELTADDIAEMQRKIKLENERKAKRKQHVPINQSDYFQQQ